MGTPMKRLILLLMVLAAAGCASTPSRPARSTKELFAARESENAVRTSDFNVLMNGFLERAHEKVEAGKAGSSTPPTIDLLIISGGGDWGAFGAGVLKGWGRVKGNMARPQFDVVTGVSTGAMIAPF